MRQHRYLVFLICILVTIFTLQASAGDEVKLLAHLNKEVLRAGESVEVQMEIVNTSKVDVEVWYSVFYINSRIVIRREDGLIPELTARGKYLTSYFDPYGMRMKNYSVELHPGDSSSMYGSIVVSDLFVLPAGKYYMRILYEDRQCRGFCGLLCSNEMTFLVTETEPDKK